MILIFQLKHWNGWNHKDLHSKIFPLLEAHASSLLVVADDTAGASVSRAPGLRCLQQFNGRGLSVFPC